MSDLLSPLGLDPHQSKLEPAENKFHAGSRVDGKHYWITPPDLYARLHAEFAFDFDPCPHPLPEGFDGLTCDWGQSSYVNPPFGSIIHQGKKKGMTAWVRKAISEQQKGKRVVMVYPLDKWILMLVKAAAEIRNLEDVRWLATEDASPGGGMGRDIACFVLEPATDRPTGCKNEDEFDAGFIFEREAKPKRPVAWRVKNGIAWMIFTNEEEAYKEAERTGEVMQGLYVKDGT